MEERKSAKKTRERLLSASLTQYASDRNLTDRKSWRETRIKPWREDVPRYARPTMGLPVSSKKAIAAAQSKLLENAWLEERDKEMWAINKKEGFKPVTVVLVSSQLQHNTSAEVLLALRETEGMLPVVYDFMADSHAEIIKLIKETLEEFGDGIKAEQLVVLCHGGPGHILLQHKQMMTSVKIRKNEDIKRFWSEVGKLMSKRDYAKTAVILGGSNFAIYPSGVELLSDLKEVIKPNKVTVKALPMKTELSSFDKDLIRSLFVSVEAYLALFNLLDNEADSYSD